MQKLIPITILTGFLGSGKTTLLNHIIRNASGRKIAVVENEFGSAGIDADLIEKSTEEIVEISDGCMCCTVRKDFIEAIERLLASGKPIDHIIIECSGMSEPLPIAQSFLMNDMEGQVKLDSIICVVDAENFTGKITSATDTALDQLEFADFVIMNKSDLVSLDQMDFIETVVRRVNAWAPIIRTSQAIVSLDLLLDTARIDETKEQEIREKEDDHTHSESLTSFTYRSEFTFDTRALDTFFAELSYDIYRAKWFVHLKEKSGMRYILQKAWARMTLVPDENWKWEDIRNTLVFIGENINPFLLNIELVKCR